MPSPTSHRGPSAPSDEASIVPDVVAADSPPHLPLPLSELLQQALATEWIVLAMAEGERLVLRSPAFEKTDDQDALRSQLAPLCARVVEAGAPIRRNAGEESGDPVEAGSISFIGVPLRDPVGRTIGALGAAAPAPRRWTNRDLEVVESVAQWLRAPLQLEAAEQVSRQAEVALARSEELYRQLVESASDIIYQANREGCFTYANEAAERVTGFSREELMGMHFTELVPEEFQRHMVEMYNRQIEEGLPTSYFEFPALRRDGSRVWLGQNVQLLWDEGEVVGVQAVARDVSERRRVEEESPPARRPLTREPEPGRGVRLRGPRRLSEPRGGELRGGAGARRRRGDVPQDPSPAHHRRSARPARASRTSRPPSADRTFSWTYRPHAESGVVQLFAVDITGRRLMEEQLRHDALHDALTGLPNRLLFMERLAHAIARSRRRDELPLRRALPRPGPLQGGQRQPRPPRRRRAARW